MFCTHCGATLKDGATFCPQCGQSMTEPKDELLGILPRKALSVQEKIKEQQVSKNFFQRVGAFTIDFALVYAFFILGGALLMPDIFELDSTLLGWLIICTTLFYHGLSLTIKEKTIGKHLFGLKVVNASDQRKISATQSFGRSIGYIPSSVFFGLGFLWAAFDAKAQAWHDKMANTIVVKNRPSNALAWPLALIAAAAVTAIVLYGSQTEVVQESPLVTNTSKNFIEEAVSRVVSLNCFYKNDDDDFNDDIGYIGSGSGTILLKDGVILTNAHVIADERSAGKKAICFISLPNPSTGEASEGYVGVPIHAGEISDSYDIALVSIVDAMEDQDTGEKLGVWPRTFPSIEDESGCLNRAPALGEKIFIVGYPSYSEDLTASVTEGIVSSKNSDGTLLTSAKVDAGNSGGSAIDANGCFVGIPTAVIKGKFENAGIIIPNAIIDRFLNEANAN